jgi:hypothetical protein
MKKKPFHYKKYVEDGILIYEIDLFKMNGSHVKMGDFLTALPYGIFDKGVTGLGGTTLELDSNRPSVIVEPLNITALSKAEKNSRTNGFKIHYFGTQSIGKGNYNNMKQNLLNYLDFCFEVGQPPKIICISDQLTHLKKLIIELEKISFNSFHLLLDEIDYMQEQTNYRESMQEAIDIYLAHPKKRRTLLSATISNFTDPALQIERTTKVRVLKFPKTSTDIYVTRSYSETIRQLITECPTTNDKYLIALNHIVQIASTIELLIKSDINSGDIAVMCSEGNKTHFPNNYGTIQNSKLPKRINFITSAFFNGYDLDEKVNLILCVGSSSPTMRLSARVLYQIQGRAREGVTSCVIIGRFGSNGGRRLSHGDVNELVKVYSPLTLAYDSMKKSKIPLVSQNAETIKNILINGLDSLQSIWKMQDGKLTFSYFKIDKILEDERIKSVMQNVNIYQQELIKYFEISSLIELNVDSDNVEVDKGALELFVEDFRTEDPYNPVFISGVLSLLELERDYIRRQLLSILLRVIYKPNSFIYQKVIDAILDCLNQDDWKYRLNILQLHVDFHSLISSDRQQISMLFPLVFRSSDFYATDVLKAKINKYLTVLLKYAGTSNSNVYSLVKKIDTPRKFERALLVCSEKRPGGMLKKKVISFNVFEILDLKTLELLDFSKEYTSPVSEDVSKMSEQELVQYYAKKLVDSAKRN